MSASTERRALRRGSFAVVLAAVGLALVPPAAGQDGTLRIHESALNDFANALGPLTRVQSFGFTVWVPNPFLIPPVVPVEYNCQATALVTGIAFDITSAGTNVRATVSGTICGLAYQAPLSSAVVISIDQTQRALRIQPMPISVRPAVNFIGLRITSPFAVNVGSSLTVPSIPLDAAPFEIETAAGPRTFVLVGRGLQLSRQDGFLEIRGNVRFR